MGIAILFAMGVFVALMMTRRLATPLALFALAIVIGILLGLPWIGKSESILGGIVSAGAVTLATTMVTVIFGSWLGAVMDETGIAQSLVRKAVELGGERPYAVAFGVWFVSIFVGTVTGSAPAAILIGLIGIPAMLAAGVPPVVAASTIVVGLACGNPFQLQTWNYLSQALGVPIGDVQAFMLRFFPIVLAGGIVFLLVQARFAGRVRAWAVNVGVPPKRVPGYALITPVIPIGLVLGSAALRAPIDIIPAVFAGILYGVLTTQPRRFNSIMLKTAYKGLELAAAPTYLFIVIGMLLTAVRMPGIVPAMKPIVNALAPHNPWAYAILFGAFAPLALYRGPLNIVGMGVGIAGVLLTLGTYPALLILGTFASISVIVGVSDPTSTQTVWSAEYSGVRPEAVMRLTLPYTWAIAIAGIILAVLLYLR
ncbi:MAG: transporter [Candidatus Eremiobacteraeota bacterium]|nr:transporter [Candidatus Eremiobacteraeota bacterium]